MDKEQLKHRILARTKKTSSCWFYVGTKASGYGTLVIDGKREVVHRLMYEIEVGEIPKGFELDHLCNNKNCLNPEHLEAVTHLENTRRGPQAVEGTLDAPIKEKKPVYCLYIKEELFKTEKNKSQLVNNLLERHYHDTVDGGKTQEDVHRNIKIAQEALLNAPVPEVGRYVQTPQGVVGPTQLKTKAMTFCKNGHPIPANRDKCLGKKCQFA